MDMDTPEVCDGEGDNEMPLPGFRFHPTDEELVSFYLRRKVEKRPISLELIKQIDIYKHNPWDLPYGSCSNGGGAGEKEWYFFCRRGRKYKNSIRPNRVTGSGFWKATGIDKPVYSNGGEGNECIGLKKTLVYYRGSAGKGTKTDWMMHEFRLPPPNPNPTNQKLQPNSKNFAEQAEIWTLCRIFKRNVSCRRYGSSWNKQTTTSTTTTTKTNPMMSSANNNICNNLVGADHDHDHQKSGEISYINFSCESMIIHNQQVEKKPPILQNYPNEWNSNYNNNYYHQANISSCCSVAPSPVSSSGIISPPVTNQLDVNDFFTNSNWDELRSMVGML